MAAGPDGAEGQTVGALQRQLAAALAERDAAQAREVALAEVLQSINASSGDLAPVFDTIIGKAMALCEADFGALLTYENDHLSLAAQRNGPPTMLEYWSRPQHVEPGLALFDVLRDARTSQIADLSATEGYRRRLPMVVASVELGGIRTLLQVPLMSERGPVGLFVLYRQEVRPFTDRQVALVEAFAAQAALAMENARLLIEQREALAQQTATAEVLEVINASPGELVPVFDAMLEKAMRLCESAFGVFGRFDGTMFEAVADRGVPAALMDAVRHIQSPPANSGLGRLAAGKAVVQLADLADTEVYRAGFVGATALVDIAGARTAIFVALRKDDALLGAIVMYRREVRPFTDKQIALLQNFASQAVIAMENARLLTEQREALEQQTATAEILRVISQSPTDIGPVMAAVARAAVRFCGAEDAHVFLRDGDEIVSSAHEGPLSAHPMGHRDPLDIRLSRAQSIIEARVTHIADTMALDSGAYSLTRSYSVQHGFRAQLNAPMLRDGGAIGCICLRRAEPGAFTPRQIELLETFAAQAVIAIENVRLFTELRESLEQQTATADILRVISRSPTDVGPVLSAVAKAALRFCGAEDVVIGLRDGEHWLIAGHEGAMPADIGSRVPLTRQTSPGQAILDAVTVHFPDIASLDPVEYAAAHDFSRRQGFLAALAAPMLREGHAIGSIALRKAAAGTFTARQIALLEGFAAQAVIAIENTRLFTELRESLERQTATTEILQAINGSPGDLQPVFDAIVDKAMTLCDAAFGMFNTFDGQRFHTVATRGVPDAYARYRLSNPPDYSLDTAPARLIAGEDCIHVADMADSDVYRRGDPNRRAIVELGGARTILNVALRKEGTLLGMIAIYRQKVRPFSSKEIALLEGFAAQAIIAMDNARLLGELTRREEELRVTFDHMGDGVAMFDAGLRLASWNRNFQELLDVSDSFLATRPGLDDYIRFLVERGEFGAVDLETELRRYRADIGRQWSVERARPDGRIIEVRNNPVPGGGAVLIYSDVTVRKRAESEIRAARDAAEAALDKLRAAQANLVQSEKMATLGQLTAGIAHEIKNPLNFVNNFASLSVELLDELKEVAGPALATLDGDARAEVDETMALLTANLGKITEHGKRADGIVKSMLSHSRGGAGDWQPSDVNTLVEEALNLAYHGARAQDKEFNVTLERDFEKTGKPIDVVPQDVTRVFLNLFGNGFYAANKRRVGARDAGYRPMIRVTTRDLGEVVEVRVRDNGTGIPPEVREKLFQPFFTTKPTGEGTGLGLSISYDIVTQQHGGTIEVESEPGSFTEFTVRLPRSRRAAPSGRA